MTIFTQNSAATLADLLPTNPDESIFILTDTVTQQLCLPALQTDTRLQHAQVINIPNGDDNKTLNTLTDVWEFLSDNGATRHSLLINLGGGMVTDLGGFAAATFKRGIDCINIPTTLLGAIDASSGGKTGINFLGLKNEIGAFHTPKAVLIDINFFRTLDTPNLLSGFAEMIKHALIGNNTLLNQTLTFDFEHIDYDLLETLVRKNIDIKERIVAQDPHEHGLRKALNFGHTIGHAFETLSHKIDEPLLHGYAVMWGLLCELYLSHIQHHFPTNTLTTLLYFAKEHYGAFPFTCKQYETLFDLMKHDKKNEAQTINFTLLADVGEVRIDQTATKEQIFEALDFVREN
ncbi:MAG: 3-dehydroquinate synthase [Paludibacteraceae bacterium]